MGKKNYTGVRRVSRGGQTRWVIDFLYSAERGGVKKRYRRDATVQNGDAARREALQLMRHAQEHGAPTLSASASAASGGLTYAEFVEGHFKESFLPTYRPATRVRYEALHRQCVLAFFGGLPLSEIDANHVRAFAADLHVRRVQTKGPLNLVRTVLRAAVESGARAAALPFPKGLIATSRKVPDAPTREEVDALIASGGWLGLAVALAAYTGLRSGEVRALQARDVDLANSRIVVRRALSEDEERTPKGNHERSVPLTPSLEARLASATVGLAPTSRVVVDDRGRTPRRQDLLVHLHRRLRSLGLEPRPFHSLRHFFVSELVRRGAGVEAVRVLAGHSSLVVTQRYAHATEADLRHAIDAFGPVTGRK